MLAIISVNRATLEESANLLRQNGLGVKTLSLLLTGELPPIYLVLSKVAYFCPRQLGRNPKQYFLAI
jgi:hypothetical protein